MSDSSYDHAKAFIPTSDFVPGHQLPARTAMAPSPGAYTATSDPNRTQQLDAGVMQTLNLQAKLAIGAPNDLYEQEADQVAAQVVERINTPQTQQKSIQRQDLPEEEELQMKPLAAIQRQDLPEEEELQMKPLATIQRQELPEEEELQMKPLAAIQRQELPEEEELQMKPLVQRQEAAGGVATANLEASLNTARGQGEPLTDDVRGSMEQAFGAADFSEVRVHTDSQSDQLNHSLQARAFTTGQDIFFKQGEYQPDHPGGQELLAHELTHVVQQNGSTVQPQER